MKDELAALLHSALARDLTAPELGQLADIHFGARNARLAADKVAAAHKEVEVGSEQLLIEQMLKQGVSAAGGHLLRVALAGPDYVPQVKDWQAFYGYIQETGAFELLERRPGKAAARERWEAGEIIPGIDKFPVYKLTRNGVK
jgi:hypothetical protein